MNARIWTVPADRIKAGRDHRVPLSDEAMNILSTMREVATGRPCVSRLGEWKAPCAQVVEEGPEDSRRRLGDGSRLPFHLPRLGIRTNQLFA